MSSEKFEITDEILDKVIEKIIEGASLLEPIKIGNSGRRISIPLEMIIDRIQKNILLFVKGDSISD